MPLCQSVPENVTSVFNVHIRIVFTHSQSERSCRSSPSWRCQKTPGWGWLAGAGVPAPPAERDQEDEVNISKNTQPFITPDHILRCLLKHTQVSDANSQLIKM